MDKEILKAAYCGCFSEGADKEGIQEFGNLGTFSHGLQRPAKDFHGQGKPTTTTVCSRKSKGNDNQC